MFKKVISSKGFWRSVLILAVAFMLIFNLVRAFFEHGFHLGAYFNFYFQPNHLFNFLISNIVGAVLYGFIMAFYKYYRHYKNQED